MPKISQIMQPLADLTISFGEVDVSLKYRPSNLTPEVENLIKTLDVEGEGNAAFLDLFIRLVHSWDLTLDDPLWVVKVGDFYLSDTGATTDLAHAARLPDKETARLHALAHNQPMCELEEIPPPIIPVTLNGIKVVPYEVLTAILEKVQGEIFPNLATEKTSVDGSLPVASSENVPSTPISLMPPGT